MAEPARWRATFDSLERRVGRRLEAGVETGEFQELLALLIRLRAGLNGAVEAASSRLLHALNLPAYSDVRRLSEQLSRLERRVREVSIELERRREQSNGRRRGTRG